MCRSSFTLQPLVENAIKHGISNLLEGGNVRIFSTQVTDGYTITVEDNAGSFTPPDDNHQGLGLDIVTKRLEHYFGRDATLKINSEPDKFTRMTFMMPASDSPKGAKIRC